MLSSIAGLQLARDERAVSHFRCTCCTRNALLRELRYVYRGMATWMGGPLGPIQRVIVWCCPLPLFRGAPRAAVNRTCAKWA